MDNQEKKIQEEVHLRQFNSQVEQWAKTSLEEANKPLRGQGLFDINPHSSFSRKGDQHLRQKRSSCPGGVGNFGFNSFNFMTFVLLTLNAVANVNNNINNNNNNNVDINYNTINQDSNNVVSNSENMNMVMAMILPVPGKRSIQLFNR